MNSDCSVLLVGNIEEEYKKELMSMAQRLNVSDSLIFRDSVPHDKLSKFLNCADIGVWPGKLGITAIEAIGTGLPLIVSNEDAMAYLVSNENGFIFPSGNEQILAERVQMYLDNPSLLEAHSQNAAQFARNELYWENIAKKSIEIYKNKN